MEDHLSVDGERTSSPIDINIDLEDTFAGHSNFSGVPGDLFEDGSVFLGIQFDDNESIQESNQANRQDASSLIDTSALDSPLPPLPTQAVPQLAPSKPPFEWLVDLFKPIFKENKIPFPSHSEESELLKALAAAPLVFPNTISAHVATRALSLAINESQDREKILQAELLLNIKNDGEKKKPRGPYNCPKCGKPKRGHKCEPPTAEIQTDDAGVDKPLTEGFKIMSSNDGNALGTEGSEPQEKISAQDEAVRTNMKRRKTGGSRGSNKKSSSSRGKKKPRGPYNCPKCGNAKKGHKCPKAAGHSIGTQTDVTGLPENETDKHT